MTKLAIIPFTIVLETIFLNKKFRSSSNYLTPYIHFGTICTLFLYKF